MKIKIILIFLIFFLLIGISVYSQEPIPTTLKGNNSPEYPPKYEKNNTGINQQGTEKSPIFVKIINTTNTQQKSSQNQPNKQETPTLYHFLWWFLPADALTAWFTLALVIVGIVTAIFLIFQFNLFKEQVTLARKEFIATYPPKLKIRSISLNHGSIQTGGINNRPWTIWFLIDNIGESTATIQKGIFTFKKLEEPLDVPPPYSDKIHIFNEKTIIRGGSINEFILFDLNDEGIKTLRLYEASLNGGSQGVNSHDLYFFGYIDYLDSIKNKKRIAFCRRYNVVSKQFTAINNEDYEYSY